MYDFVFKALFAREDKTSKKLLIDLLNDILSAKSEDTICSVTYLNPFNYKEFESDKLSILDIKAKTEKGERVNIEIQVKLEDDYRKRSLYYWAKTYAETIEESESYSSLKKTIVINIVDYNEIKESTKLHTHFKLLEKEESFVLTEDLQIHYLELPKLPAYKNIDELEGVELWAEFLIAGRESNEEKLEKLKLRSDTMKAAVESLETVSADERMREIQRAREKSRLDMLSKLDYAKKQGLQQGLQQGLEQGVINTAEEMLKLGVDIQIIMRATKLSLDKIRELEAKLKDNQN
jgi:predicted transposase/invertase (TIGR01784 family)